MVKQARERIKENRLRHPRLKLGSHHLRLYNWLELNPDSTYADIKAATDIHPQVLSDLRNDGLVVQIGKIGPRGVFRIAPENRTGMGRDKVEIELTVFKNEYGEFSVSSKLIGQMPGADTDGNPRPVFTKKVSAMIPRDGEPASTRPVFAEDWNGKPDQQTFAKSRRQSPSVVDAEYTVIDQKE